MDLKDFKEYITAQREASKAQALSVLTATITNNKTEKENN